MRALQLRQGVQAGYVRMLRVLLKKKKKKVLYSQSRSHEEAVFPSKLRATAVSAVTSSKLVKSEKFAFGGKDD